ncbi:hypothetical protein [Chromatocurvus halotolerans]|uniref:Putative secreted protein with PEP-CTERM sorting signal n=1 Tax=Chromatocurvus halotolerans TaxID=1132028 RepID=A0A4R2KM34_9GAMM|nr:hypothetical protein [Chromatocurvus halotolerans]TCO73702.1 putative secreted protein with PEP-CTERM sorting signal [Chromatocurvus halotolerans]
MMKFSIRPLIPIFCAMATVAYAGSALGAAILTGDSAADGWTLIGNSRDSENVIFSRLANGSEPTDFDTYFTTFVLSASDSFNANSTDDVRGSDTGTLVTGSWMTGDRIIGLGINDASPDTQELTTAFFKLDFGGTGNWTPASTLDGNDGSASTSGGGPGSIGASTRSSGQFAPQGQTFTPALRSFAVVSGDTSDALDRRYSSLQFLVNYDALLRIDTSSITGFVSPEFGDVSKFVVNASGKGKGTDVVFSQAALFSTVPTPGTLALLLLGLVGTSIARERR